MSPLLLDHLNTSSNNSDYKTVIATVTSSLTVNVVVYELIGTINPQDNFTGHHPTRLGIAELADLGFISTPNVSAQQIGNLTWTIVSGGGTITPGNTSGAGTFTAPASSSISTLKLEILSGPSKGSGEMYSRDVIAPAGALAIKYGTGVSHTQGYCSVGFYLFPHLLPTDVSFNQIQFREGTAVAVASGYYKANNGQIHPESFVTAIGECNYATGCKADFQDYPQTEGHAPCTRGDFVWDIPW